MALRCRWFPTRMVYLYYYIISCLRNTILVGNPRTITQPEMEYSLSSEKTSDGDLFLTLIGRHTLLLLQATKKNLTPFPPSSSTPPPPTPPTLPRSLAGSAGALCTVYRTRTDPSPLTGVGSPVPQFNRVISLLIAF